MRLLFLIVTFLTTIGVILYLRKMGAPSAPASIQQTVTTTDAQETQPELPAPTESAPNPTASPSPVTAPVDSPESRQEPAATAPAKPAPKAQVVQVTPVTVDVSKLPDPVPLEPTAPRKSHPLMPGPGPKPADAPVAAPQR